MGFWPFGRKHQSKESLQVPDRWGMLKGGADDRPVLVRLRDVKGVVGHPQFRHQIGIAVPCKYPDSYGFPGKGELSELGAIEDRIYDGFQTGNESILVAVITTNAMREFVLYTSDPEQARARFEQLRASVQTHDMQLMIQADPDWRAYRSFR